MYHSTEPHSRTSEMTCVPGLTRRFFGLTPLDVMVIVAPATGGDGAGSLLPQPVARHAIVVTTNRRIIRSS